MNFSAVYHAPPAPADPNTLLYWWIGLQQIHWPAIRSSAVLQPVLAYGDGRWWFQPWNCCPAGHKAKGPALEVTAAVRAAWPDDKPLWYRCSAVDGPGGM